MISEKQSERQTKMETAANDLANALPGALQQGESQTLRHNDPPSVHHQSFMGVQQLSQRLGAAQDLLRYQTQTLAENRMRTGR